MAVRCAPEPVSDLVGDFRSTPSEGIWHSLNKFVLTLIVLVVLLPITHAFLPEVAQRKAQAARIETLKAQLEDERMKLARNQREEMLLKRDSEYIGLIARDRLDLMREGETIYRIDPPKVNQAKFKLKQ
jgi:cell division protein FtsB